MFVSPFASPFKLPFRVSRPSAPEPVKTREQDLPRIVNYLADYGGCGFYRILWPEIEINLSGKAISQSNTCMVFDPRYYEGVKMVRMQRQATGDQLKFVQLLKQYQKQFNYKIVYEVDDVVFAEDIPNYNQFKFAFTPPEIQQSIKEIILTCDQVTVTNKFMKELYEMRTGHKNVTVIPNFPPNAWIGRLYDKQKVLRNFEVNQKRPRVLYPGSGAHIDTEGRNGGKDDFSHVVSSIIKTRKKFEWVFVGAFPLALKPYIISGEIKFIPWVSLKEYPQKIVDVCANVVIAPLVDNNFNRSKSDIKFIESGMLGLPAICQDLCTYENSFHKFRTGDEMIQQIEAVTKSVQTYSQHSLRARKVAETRFIELDSNYTQFLSLISS